MSERGSRHTAGEGAAAEGAGEEVAEEDGAVVEEHLLVVEGEGEEGGGPEGPSVGEAGDGQEGEAQADPWRGGRQWGDDETTGMLRTVPNSRLGDCRNMHYLIILLRFEGFGLQLFFAVWAQFYSTMRDT